MRMIRPNTSRTHAALQESSHRVDLVVLGGPPQHRHIADAGDPAVEVGEQDGVQVAAGEGEGEVVAEGQLLGDGEVDFGGQCGE